MVELLFHFGSLLEREKKPSRVAKLIIGRFMTPQDVGKLSNGIQHNNHNTTNSRKTNGTAILRGDFFSVGLRVMKT